MGTDLNALENAADFDREFIVQMIPHPEIRNLAQSIARSQSAEIEQMQQWYQTWYPQR